MSSQGKFVPFFDGSPSVIEKRQMKKDRRRVERRRSNPYKLLREYEKEMEMELGDDCDTEDYEYVDDIAALLRHFAMERDIQEEQEWVDLLTLND